jgi:hypothetical protein
MGSEHAIEDTAAVVQWMEREWSSMEDGPDEPLVDSLGTRAKFVRVNLRQYRANGYDRHPLVTAFIATGNPALGDTSALSCALRSLNALSARGLVPWSPDSLQAAAQIWKSQGYPAVSHSPDYRKQYRPAYRVVDVSLVGALVHRP